MKPLKNKAAVSPSLLLKFNVIYNNMKLATTSQSIYNSVVPSKLSYI